MRMRARRGDKFGMLTVIGDAPSDGYRRRVKVLCECGNKKNVRVDSLNIGSTKSCGCLRSREVAIRSTTHGRYESLAYRAWVAAKSHSCGICKKWGTFEGFFEDMGDPPEGTRYLHRKNKTKPHSKSNCYYDKTIQNTTPSKPLTVGSETKSAQEWSQQTGIPVSTILWRMRHGWRPEYIVTIPKPGART